MKQEGIMMFKKGVMYRLIMEMGKKIKKKQIIMMSLQAFGNMTTLRVKDLEKRMMENMG